MLRFVLSTTCLTLLLVWPAGAPAAGQAEPSGQFAPAPGDRDGDGVGDAGDCAPDDPSRPARPGPDADCDGYADGGPGSRDAAISGPAQEPSPVTGSSSATGGTTATRTLAWRSAGERVVLVRHLPLGRSVAVYRTARRHRSAATLVFAARDGGGVSVTPTLVYAGGSERKLADRQRAPLAAGRAWTLRVRTGGLARPVASVRFSIAVIDLAGDSFSATTAVRTRRS